MYELGFEEKEQIESFISDVFDTKEKIFFYPYMINGNTYYNAEKNTLYANVIHMRALLDFFEKKGLTITDTGVGYVLSIVS